MHNEYILVKLVQLLQVRSSVSAKDKTLPYCSKKKKKKSCIGHLAFRGYFCSSSEQQESERKCHISRPHCRAIVAYEGDEKVISMINSLNIPSK